MKFRNPFLSFASLDVATQELKKEFSELPANEVEDAALAGWAEMQAARDDMKKKGEEVLSWMEENHKRGIVLAGRPYHIDPEINHGIPELITSYGPRRFDRRFRFPSGMSGSAADRFRPVDVSFPPVRGRYFRAHPGRSGSDPAQFLRLRSGCRDHGSGQRYSVRIRQDLYLPEDR